MEINKITIENLDNDILHDNINILNDNLIALSSYKIDPISNTKSINKLKNHDNIDVNENEVNEVNEVNEAIDVDILKNMVIRWIKLDDTVKEHNKTVKELKEEKTQIESKILLFMNNNKTNEIQVKDGKLEKKIGEKKEPINEEYIKKCLTKTFDDVEMIDKLTKLIIENREITESYKLARKSAAKKNAPKKY